MSDAVVLAAEVRALRRQLDRLEAQETGNDTHVAGVRMTCVAPGLTIPPGYALVVPDYTVVDGAQLAIEDGAELAVVG